MGLGRAAEPGAGLETPGAAVHRRALAAGDSNWPVALHPVEQTFRPRHAGNERPGREGIDRTVAVIDRRDPGRPPGNGRTHRRLFPTLGPHRLRARLHRHPEPGRARRHFLRVLPRDPKRTGRCLSLTLMPISRGGNGTAAVGSGSGPAAVAWSYMNSSPLLRLQDCCVGTPRRMGISWTAPIMRVACPAASRWITPRSRTVATPPSPRRSRYSSCQ